MKKTYMVELVKTIQYHVEAKDPYEATRFDTSYGLKF